MISDRIEEAMKKYGVTEIDALNQEFDPNFHEAVEIEMSGDVNRRHGHEGVPEGVPYR